MSTFVFLLPSNLIPDTLCSEPAPFLPPVFFLGDVVAFKYESRDSVLLRYPGVVGGGGKGGMPESGGFGHIWDQTPSENNQKVQSTVFKYKVPRVLLFGIPSPCLIPGSPLSPGSPSFPVGPAGPCTPSFPAGPEGPVGPCAPSFPSFPSSPTGPTGPTGPCAPSFPASPAGPTGPTGP